MLIMSTNFSKCEISTFANFSSVATIKSATMATKKMIPRNIRSKIFAISEVSCTKIKIKKSHNKSVRVGKKFE